MATTKARVVGSGYTVLQYNNKPIMFCEGWEDSGQRAFSDIGQPFQFIQPIGWERPAEIATSRVISGGTIMITVRELWNQPIWWALAGLKGTWNMVDIFKTMAANPNYVTASLVIKPPGTENKPGSWRGKVYQNVTPVDINDGETVTVGALSVTKGITIAYTHYLPLNSNQFSGSSGAGN
jgi:hypothetical protein